MPRLSYAERYEAIGMLRNSPVSVVAAHFNTTRRTIQLLQARMNQTGTVTDRPRTGRPKITTAADDRRIRTLHLRDRFRTASHTARTFHGQISRYTVRRRLRAYGTFAVVRSEDWIWGYTIFKPGLTGHGYIDVGLCVSGKMWSFPMSPAFCYNDTMDVDESTDVSVNGSWTLQSALPVTSVV